MTRPLTARERDILDLLLSIDLPSAGELREQAMSVSAEREGMVIDLIVNEGPPSATVVSRTPVQLPSTATATTVAYSSCGRRSRLLALDPSRPEARVSRPSSGRISRAWVRSRTDGKGRGATRSQLRGVFCSSSRMVMTSPAVLLPPRWLGRGSSRSLLRADANQAVTGRRLFSQSAKTSSTVP